MKPIHVVYIVSAPRSGSTILAKVLGQAKGVFAVGELRFFADRGLRDNWMCGCGNEFSECAVWSTIARRVTTSGEFADPEQILQSSERHRTPLGLRRLNYGNVVLRSKKQRDRMIGRTMSHHIQFLDLLYSSARDISGNSILIDSSKDPCYALVLQRVPSIELSIVHLVRDARAVTHSRVVRRKKQIASRQSTLTMGENVGIMRSCSQWLRVNHAAHRLFGSGPGRYCVLRYEDFSRDPLRELKRISWPGDLDISSVSCQEGGIELSRNHMFSGNPGRFEHGRQAIVDQQHWRTDLRPSARLLVNLLTFPLQRRYGYL